MIDKNLFNKIYEIHVKQLKNTSVPHNKLVICFSGIAGSGKTSIAKILEEKYKGIRIRNDDIREIINRFGFNDVDEITHAYVSWLFEHYPFANKLIILDSGIDRRYEEIFALCQKEGYQTFIIRLKVPERIYKKRIIEKLGKLDDNYLTRINDWKKQFEEFGKNVKSDITLNNGGKLNLASVYFKLDVLIH
jgi:predicted kinase